MSCDLNVCMSVSCQTVRSDAAEVGAKRCGAVRSGAANTERSDDDLEEGRGEHQRDPKVFTNQQTRHYLDHFEAHLMRFRPVSISKYLACYLATHSCH